MLLSYLVPPLVGALGVVTARWLRRRSTRIVCQLGGLSWDRQEFCRGWLISGANGSGKTLSGIRRILFQLFTRQRDFGCLAIDDKGTLHETLTRMAAHFDRTDDLIVLQTRPAEAPGDWVPPQRFNLVGDPSIPTATYARFIADTASALGNRREQGFFRSAAQIQMSQALAALKVVGAGVSLEKVLELLTNDDVLKVTCELLESRAEGIHLAFHFRQFAAQPPEQLAGIRGTITNYLHYFTTPEIAEVFCRDQTFDLASVDTGRILCLALPQKFQTERRYVGTFLKQLFFLHTLRRFDLSASERAERNLLVFLADEAQHFLTVSEDGTSDHSTVDVVREAGLAFIAATQSSTSLIPTLGADQSKVLLLNLRNRLIFTAADEDDALQSADFIGKHVVVRTSETSGKDGKSRTSQSEEVHRVKPNALRKLRKYVAIVVHAEHGFRKRLLRPIEADGSIPRWYGRVWRIWR